MITEIERFRAASDSGEYYTVVRLQHWTEVRPLNGPLRRLKGST